ncbi:MAG TPA: hypothetical protein VMU00_01055 [Steroidobacteraceae bacterium]|nr:hypothetical protein [Steroidobacteraceae bacterium]
MKATTIVAGAAALASLAACGGIKTKTKIIDAAHQSIQSHTRDVCLLAGALPSDYVYNEIARIKATKGTYGGTDEVLAAIADAARRVGADAVINLQASQKFKGPLPWRVTSPTGDGTAIKLTPQSPPLDCAAIGGNTG